MGNTPSSTTEELIVEYEQMTTGYDVKTTARSITAAELLSKLQANQSIFLLDTRDQTEHEVSHINLTGTSNGAVGLLIPSIGMMSVGYKTPLPDPSEIPKESIIICSCTAGLRSGYVAVDLEKKWNRPVYSLKGGIIAWVNAGGKVQDVSGEETNQVHCYSTKWGKYLNNQDNVVTTDSLAVQIKSALA